MIDEWISDVSAVVEIVVKCLLSIFVWDVDWISGFSFSDFKKNSIELFSFLANVFNKIGFYRVISHWIFFNWSVDILEIDITIDFSRIVSMPVFIYPVSEHKKTLLSLKSFFAKEFYCPGMNRP